MAQFVRSGKVPGKTRKERAQRIRAAMRAAQKATKGVGTSRAKFNRSGRVVIKNRTAGIKLTLQQTPKEPSTRTSIAGTKSDSVRQAIAQRIVDRGQVVRSGALRGATQRIAKEEAIKGKKNFSVRVASGREEKLTKDQADRFSAITKRQKFVKEQRWVRLPSGSSKILTLPAYLSTSTKKQKEAWFKKAEAKAKADNFNKLSAREKRVLAQQKRETKITGIKDKIIEKLNLKPKRLANGKFQLGANIFQTVGGNTIELLKGAGRLPFELVAGGLVIGGRIGLTADQAFTKEGRSTIVKSGKKVPKAVVKMYDPRTPEGVLNIIITAAMIKTLGKSKANQRAFNKQMNNARITKAKVTVKEISPKKVQVTKTGVLKIGKRNIPFKEVVKISKKSLKSNQFTAKSLTSYKLTPKTIKQIKSVLKGNKVVRKPLEGTRSKNVKTQTRITGKLKVGKQKGNTVILGDGKKVVSITKFKKNVSVIKAKIKNLKNPNSKVTTFDVSSWSRYLPRKTLKTQLSSVIKSLKSQLKSRTLTKTQLKNIKAKLVSLKAAGKVKISQVKNFNVKIGKKGQIIPGKRTVGDLRPQTSQVYGNRDFSVIDSLLKKVDARLKTSPFTKKVGSVGKLSSKSTILNIIKKDFSAVLIGARHALLPKVIILPGFPVPAKTGALINARTIFDVKSITQAGVDVQSRADVIAGTEAVSLAESTSSTSTIARTISKAFVTTAATAAGLASVFGPGFIPPLIPGGKTSPGGFSTFSFKRAVRVPKKHFIYLPDMISLLYGIKAKKKEAARLLQSGRIFTGLEARKIIQ